MSEIELKARELLAAQCEADGMPEAAKTVRTGSFEGDAADGFRTTISALVAALSPQWQPIESAPKDVSTFLAGEFYFTDGACVYKECSTAFRNKDGRVYCHDENVTPTHWQPLPAPPEVKG